MLAWSGSYLTFDRSHACVLLSSPRKQLLVHRLAFCGRQESIAAKPTSTSKLAFHHPCVLCFEKIYVCEFVFDAYSIYNCSPFSLNVFGAWIFVTLTTNCFWFWCFCWCWYCCRVSCQGCCWLHELGWGEVTEEINCVLLEGTWVMWLWELVDVCGHISFWFF